MKLFARVILSLLLAVGLLLGGAMLGEHSATKRYEQDLRKSYRELNNLDGNDVRIDRMREFYDSEVGRHASTMTTDDEFRLYCQEEYPTAVYHSNEWTPDEVIQSYLDTPEIWGSYYDNCCMTTGFFFTWTPNYEHCFILDNNRYAIEPGEIVELGEGWLCVDGVRVQCFGQTTTASMDPLELARAYRAGEWDGSQLWSEDLSTTVELDSWDGKLDYHYEAWRYDETYDPLGLAYTGFDDQPWYLQDGVSQETLAALPTCLTGKNQWVNCGGDNYRAFDWYSCSVYADAPADYDMSDVIDTVRKDPLGMFATFPTYIALFRNGETVVEWECPFDPKEMELLLKFKEPTAPYAHDLAYLYDKTTILALRDDGTVEPVVDEMVYHTSVYSSRNEYWCLKDNQLVCWSLSEHWLSSQNSPLVVGKDVIEVDFSTLMLFTTNDGCYAVTRVDENGNFGDTRAVYLGSESMEYYADLYKSMRWMQP